MAGIGFELRRIFGKRTLASSIYGVVYASMTTVGPTIVFLFLLFSLKYIMEKLGTGMIENMFFTSSFTYLFLFAILNASFQNNILSRYISDKIFESKEGDICASMFGMLTTSSLIASIEFIILCLLMYRKNEIPLIFLSAYYFLGILATITYTLMGYISAIKEYKEVTFSYFIGIFSIFPFLFILYKLIDFPIVLAIYWSLVMGFFIISILLINRCVKSFGRPTKNYFEFLHYFKKHPKILISGFFWILGFYMSNIIYWFFSDMKVTISIFSTAPNYDLAMFLAIMINLSGTVIFIVKTETRFYDKYVSYLSAVNNGVYEIIEKKRISLENTVNLQMFYVYEVQLIITIILSFLANIFYPYLGINTQTLSMFLLLGLGLYCAFCMYFTMVFLYYFDDHFSACIGPSIFLIIVTVGSLITSKLGSPYYPIPLLIGGIVGWLVSFILLSRRIKKLNSYLLCK